MESNSLNEEPMDISGAKSKSSVFQKEPRSYVQPNVSTEQKQMWADALIPFVSKTEELQDLSSNIFSNLTICKVAQESRIYKKSLLSNY